MDSKVFNALVDVKAELKGVINEVQNVNGKIDGLVDEVKILKTALYEPEHGVYVQLHDAATKKEFEILMREKSSLAAKVKDLLTWKKRMLWFFGITTTTLLTAGAKPLWAFITAHVKFVF